MNLLKSFAEAVDVSSIEEMLLRVVAAALVLMLGAGISRFLTRRLVQRIQKHESGDDDSFVIYKHTVQLVILVITVSLTLHILGLNLTRLLTAGGLFAVAAAFALKTASENLVSGFIIRIEDAIKRGDVLSLEDGQLVKVKKIGPRATIVRSKTEENLIIPNSALVQRTIANLTFRDTIHRIQTTVGVSYSSDLHQVRAVLEQVCSGLDWRVEHVTPRVLLHEFGNSSVNFQILVWIDDPWNRNQFLSQLNEQIWWALKKAGIVIAFPQLDVHFDQNIPAPGPMAKEQA